MVIVYIKSKSFVKNVDEKGNQIDYNFKVIQDLDGTIKIKNPYIEKGFKEVELDDKYADCISSDFNDDLTFSIEKYNTRKQSQTKENYENKIIALIRQRYSVNQELAILRQRDSKPEEFAEYNEYVEQCKQQVKESMGLNNENL